MALVTNGLIGPMTDRQSRAAARFIAENASDGLINQDEFLKLLEQFWLGYDDTSRHSTPQALQAA